MDLLKDWICGGCESRAEKGKGVILDSAKIVPLLLVNQDITG